LIALPPSVFLADFSQAERHLIAAVIAASSRPKPENPRYAAIARNLGGSRDNRERVIRRARVRLVKARVLDDSGPVLRFNPEFPEWVDPDGSGPLVSESLARAIRAYDCIQPDSAVRLDAIKQPDSAVRLQSSNRTNRDCTRTQESGANHPSNRTNDACTRTVGSGCNHPTGQIAPPDPIEERASAPVREEELNQDDDRSSSRTREGTGEPRPLDHHPAWTPERLARVAPAVKENFLDSLGALGAEDLATEVGRLAPTRHPDYLAAAVTWAAELSRRGKVKSSCYGLIVTLSDDWEDAHRIPEHVRKFIDSPRSARRREVPVLELYPYVAPIPARPTPQPAPALAGGLAG
jgi:hypothetical protein